MHRADFGRSGNYRATGVRKLGGVRQEFDHASENTARCVLAGDVAYFAGTDAQRKPHVWAVNRKTGNELWSVATPGDRFVFTAPLVRDGRVYFGGPDGKLHCVNAKTANHPPAAYLPADRSLNVQFVDEFVSLEEWNRLAD